MKFLRKQLDSIKPHFSKGGKWEKLHYAFDAFDTFAFSPGTVTESRGVQVRDSIDLKRLMLTVIVSMVPCLLFGIWNVGFQTSLATGQEMSSWEMFQTGLWKVVPLIIVSYASGLTVEFIFASMRKHPVNEGFLVTGMLIPLVMPPDIPLWQVSLATVFAVVIGKEAFGGTGMNILNVALTARAFLYFAYPVNMAGEVWTYIPSGAQKVAGYSGATPLAVAAESATAGVPVTEAFEKFGAGWADNLYTFAGMFTGFIPGSVGETSTLMCLAGALILVATGVGSGKIIFSVFAGAYSMGLLFNLIGGNPFVEMPAHYHLVTGGLAFGAVFMATDPVTAAHTETGKWIYGFLIGLFTVLIRVANPAYPEGIMLAILLMNVFAPLIDYFVVGANKARRLKRATV
jgi:Na+-transporting NADH:ubiquinone oxidoreductase subunit B